MPELDTQVVESLVKSAADGDKAAQQQLFKAYWPLVENVVRIQRAKSGAVLRQREDTHGSLQEIAIRVLQQLKDQQWQGKSAFIGWLCTLAKSQVMDQARVHNAKKRGPGAQAPLDEDRVRAYLPGMETWADAKHKKDKVQELAQGLPEAQQVALSLAGLGYSQAQIAAALDCTEEAARKHISRGRAKLTALIGKTSKA